MFLIKVSISQHILRSRYLYSQGNAEDIVHVPDQSMFFVFWDPDKIPCPGYLQYIF